MAFFILMHTTEQTNIGVPIHLYYACSPESFISFLPSED